MKTLLFTIEYPPFHGGVANYYGNLIKYWPAFAPPGGATAGKPEPDNIFVLNNNEGRLIYNNLPFLKWLPAYFALREKIRQEKIEHILVGHILPLGAAAIINAKFNKTKYSVILHGLDLAMALKSQRKTWLAGKILKYSEKIICANSYVADLARRAWPEVARKIVLVNPGVENLITDLPAAGLAEKNKLKRITQLCDKYDLYNKIILLSVGRLVKRKGFGAIIELLPEVLEKMPGLAYVILGDGPEIKNLQLLTKNLKLDKSVHIISQADDEERNLWYNISDIFIMAAKNIDGDFEGFGLVYLEANLAGKPVIAGRSGGVTDAVIDGLNGLLVDPEDTNQIAAAIIKLIQDPALRQRLGEQGRERALKEFNWEKQIDKIYKTII